MNDFLLSILLGVVEGLTEFLPVSSTGHLRIVEALFHLNLGDSFWKMYTIVIQLGAILALPVYFRDRILKFLSTFPKGERGDRNFLTHPLSLTMVAFVVTALPAWALTKVIGKNLESLWVITIALLVGGKFRVLPGDVENVGSGSALGVNETHLNVASVFGKRGADVVEEARAI